MEDKRNCGREEKRFMRFPFFFSDVFYLVVKVSDEFCTFNEWANMSRVDMMYTVGVWLLLWNIHRFSDLSKIEQLIERECEVLFGLLHCWRYQLLLFIIIIHAEEDDDPCVVNGHWLSNSNDVFPLERIIWKIFSLTNVDQGRSTVPFVFRGEIFMLDILVIVENEDVDSARRIQRRSATRNNADTTSTIGFFTFPCPMHGRLGSLRDRITSEKNKQIKFLCDSRIGDARFFFFSFIVSVETERKFVTNRCSVRHDRRRQRTKSKTIDK